MALAAIAAMALGAGAIASARTHHVSHNKSTTQHAKARTSQAAQSKDQADNEQAGSEKPDAGEVSGGEQSGNDGPGGHADEPGNPNADHQATGEE